MDAYTDYTPENPLRGVIGVLRDGERFLLIRRAGGVRAAGLWCFPGGSIEPDEPEPDALVRELREELGIRVVPGERLFVQVKHDGRLVLHWWSARHIDGDLRPNPAEVADLRWLTPDEVRRLPDAIPGTSALFDHLGL
jgi:8-oxo-dGTP diphosphatase